MNGYMKFLSTPYPFYENTRQGLKICSGIGLFITLFCVLFQPFGLDSISTISQVGYGVVSFLVCLLFIVILPLLLPKYLQNKGWTIGKEIAWISAITLSLGIANYFYSGFVFEAGYQFHLPSFLLVCLYTLLVAIIPAIAIILYKQVFEFKKVLKDAAQLEGQLTARSELTAKQSNGTELKFRSELKSDALSIDISNFVFLVSSGNYVEIHFENDGNPKKHLVRNSISNIENDLQDYEQLIRCHRSYLVNLDKVEHINGNLQGYQLEIKNHMDLIPVSRSYTKRVKSILMKNA